MSIPLRWYGEDADSEGNVPLPDTPAPFAYADVDSDPGEIIAYGGGQGANLYLNPIRVELFVFVPSGVGLPVALGYAETAAALFRSYRDAHISVASATVRPGGDGSQLRPPGLASEVDNYIFAAVEVDLHFYQIG